MGFCRVAALGAVVAWAGCGRPAAPKPRPAHALPVPPRVVPGEPGRPGGRFVIVTAAAPKTFNPLFAFDSASDTVTRMLFSSLVILNPVTQEPEPGLAESWSVAPDQKTWTFKLRQGLRWSDGDPLTAEDVVFTWNEVMYDTNCNQVTYDLFRMGGTNFAVTQSDEVTVRIVTPDIFAPFLEFFGTVAILPKHTLEPAVRQHRFAAAYSPNTRPDQLAGCGPYRLKEYQSGKFTRLERNPEYWVTDQQGRRLPYFDEILVNVGGGPGTEPVLFLQGNSDVCETVRPENYAEFQQAAAAGRCQLAELGLATDRDFLWFNQNTGTNATGQPIVRPIHLKWFRNKKFRQAVSCAMDRDRLVREVYNGRARPIYGFLSTENQKWNHPNIPVYSYDPVRAKALLAEIGLADRDHDGVLEDADGNKAEILFHSNSGNPAREKTAGLIQEDLQKVGLRLIYLPLDFRALVRKINVTCDYECALMGLGGGASDPASQINVLRSSEELHQWFPFQKSPSTDWEAKIDTLMDAQMRTLDFHARKRAFDEVQTILAEELPMIYTVAPLASAAIRTNVANLRPSILTPYRLTWNIEELYFRKP